MALDKTTVERVLARGEGGPQDDIDTVPRLPPDTSYDEFFSEFLAPNRPCVFDTRTTKSWRSVKEWVNECKPNFEYLKSSFGDSVVPITACGESYDSQVNLEMSLAEYIDYWQSYIDSGYESSTKSCLYLKDWHFIKNHPFYEAYSTFPFFDSDWLNEYWDSKNDSTEIDYRFIYMGPKGSCWSANICGKKEWLLFPPGEEEFLKDRNGKLPVDANKPSVVETHRGAGRKGPVKVTQLAGEIIFVPSGWHHQVYNSEDTISINHNWVNGCNIGCMWRYIQSELLKVKYEIRDCVGMDEWDEHCQVILKANCGIDYAEFINMLSVIFHNRVVEIDRVANTTTTEPHIYYDLKRISMVLEYIRLDEDVKLLSQSKLNINLDDFIEKCKEYSSRIT